MGTLLEYSLIYEHKWNIKSFTLQTIFNFVSVLILRVSVSTTNSMQCIERDIKTNELHISMELHDHYVIYNIYLLEILQLKHRRQYTHHYNLVAWRLHCVTMKRGCVSCGFYFILAFARDFTRVEFFIPYFTHFGVALP